MNVFFVPCLFVFSLINSIPFHVQIKAFVGAFWSLIINMEGGESMISKFLVGASMNLLPCMDKNYLKWWNAFLTFFMFKSFFCRYLNKALAFPTCSLCFPYSKSFLLWEMGQIQIKVYMIINMDESMNQGGIKFCA